MGVYELFMPTPRRVRYVSSAMAVTAVIGKSPAVMYREQPALRSVISFLADSVASLPLKCYRNNGDDRPRDTDSPLALLLERPNPRTTTHELIRATVTDYLLYGNAIWYVVPSADTESGWEASNIPWAWVRDVRTADGLQPSEFVVQNYDTRTAPITVKAEDVLWFRMYDPESLVGVCAPVEALKHVLAEQVAALDYRNKVWQNGGWFSRWLGLPAGVQWSPEARDRFAKSWKTRFSGKEGTDSGGTPILEDGMVLHESALNAHEAQWREATILAREDVAGVYHLNPATIWHTNRETYASAKDNARALYADTLAIPMDYIAERLNKDLALRVGAPDSYAEFDISAKIAGTFEEQVKAFQTATGAPVLTRAEARRKMNLPYIEGTEQLIVPLNVSEGGLASPYDTDPTRERYNAGDVQAKDGKTARKSRAGADEREAQAVTDVVRAHMERQRKSVLPKLAKAKKDADAPEWWDGERWDRELGEDLEPVLMALAVAQGNRTVQELGLERFDAARIRAYIRKTARGRAEVINNTTRAQLEEDLEEEEPDPAHVFDVREERANGIGVGVSAACAEWALREALTQNTTAEQRRDVLKTWVVQSFNPRPSHARANGQTVRYGEVFNNGLPWPHSFDGDPSETCGCMCTLELVIP